MKFKETMLGLITLMGSGASIAQQPAVPLPGYYYQQSVSPADYQAMPPAERQLYIAGVLDTDRVYSPMPTRQLFATCLIDVGIETVTNIVDRDLAEIQKDHRVAMPFEIHNALVKDCDRRGYRIP